jgi:hypothetical protein
MGTVAVLVKDTPVTLDNGQVVTEVNITISKILMKKEMEPEDAWVEVKLNPLLVQPFNLLALDNVATVAALDELPTGEYEKVRLVLDEFSTASPCIVLKDTTDCIALKVPSHKIDIVLKPHVLVTQGSTASIVLDFVPHIVTTNGQNEYILQPLIRAVTAELPAGIRAHNEISGAVTNCTDNTFELSLRQGTVHVTIHYDDATQFFSDEHVNVEDEDVDDKNVDINDEQQVPLTSITCNDLLGKRVEVKVLALPDGTLYAVRVEIKGEFHELEEFQVSGTLPANSNLTLHTTTADYAVIFPEGTIKVEGMLSGNQTILARQIETQSVTEDFQVIGTLDSDASLTLTDAQGTLYTIHFPTQPIKVEGILDETTTPNTITAREVEALVSREMEHE